MIIKSSFCLTLFTCMTVLLTLQVKAQDRKVKFRFEVEGKPVKVRPKITLSANGKNTKPEISEGYFNVPANLKNIEKVDVRFTAGEYDLLFKSVYLSKFDGEWVVGVDKKPFDSANISSAEPGKRIKQVHYIEFRPDKGDGTRMTVIVYKP